LHNNFDEFKSNDSFKSLLFAALESMSDGFTIWSEDLKLLAFNNHYEEMYFNNTDGLEVGMSLLRSCELSIQNGNYENISPKGLCKKFSTFLIKASKSNSSQVFERKIKGETIRSTFINATGVGQIVTHKNITKEIKQEQLKKHHEEELIEKNTQFSTAINHMSHGLCLFKEDRRLITCNKAYASLYNLPKHLVKSGTLFDDILNYRIKNNLVDKSEGNEEFIKNRLGVQNDINGVQTFVETINGRSIDVIRKKLSNGGWVSTQQDITEQHQKEELIERRSNELLQQNMRFDAAVNNMSHALAQFDKDNKLIICNQPYINLYKLPENLAKPGTSFWDILDHDAQFDRVSIADKKQRFEILSEVLKAAQATKGPITMLNGQIIFISFQPMKDGGWLTIHEDITEQHQKEELIEHRSNELLQQNMRFDAAVNNMSHGLAMFDKDHNLVICNQPYAILYDLPKELSRSGANFWDILDHGAKTNMISIANKKQRFEILNKVIKDHKPITEPVTMLNGQIIFINHQPLDDGGWLTTHEDITEQHKSEELIRYLARHDGLTDLSNRRNFHEIMEKNQNNFTKENTKDPQIMAVLSIDLDRFKPINDNFGHDAGDEVIKEVGRRILLHVGLNGSVARLGGDEFAALIGPVSSYIEIEKIADKITQAILKPIKWDGIELNITASIGISTSPNDGQDTQSLMKNSDLALYYAKKQLGGSYCFFEEEMDAKRKKRQIIENGLRQALEKNELTLHYQPLVCMETNKITACEALMRWESEEHNFSPFDFIPVAEETGLIRDMGNWALQEACLTAAKWQNNERIAVNVSLVQFKNNNLVAQVADALIVSGLDADRLELEITESLFLENSEHNLKILHDLKSLGVKIALDDFGTGYSSLSYLRSFPFDKLKIDRSFICCLEEKAENIAIVKAIVDISQSMGMTTVAEGVETQKELDAVRSQGCDQVQGYLFSPPLPKKAINEMLIKPMGEIKRKTA